MGKFKDEITPVPDRTVKIFKSIFESRNLIIPKKYISWEEACMTTFLLYTEDGKHHGTHPRAISQALGRDLVGNVFAKPGSPCFLVKSMDLEESRLERLDNNFIAQFKAEGTVFFESSEAEEQCSFLVFKTTGDGKVSFFRLGKSLSLHFCEIDRLEVEAPNESREVMWVLKTLLSDPEFEDVDLPTPRAQGFGNKKQSSLLDCERAKILKPRILPVNPARVDHGGTHASPRPHDRRGHWRRKPKGETSDLIWVKPSKIGVKKDE